MGLRFSGWQQVKPIRYSNGDDDRRACSQCANLKGPVCSVARPGGVVSAVVGYKPALPDMLQRCKGYKGE